MAVAYGTKHDDPDREWKESALHLLAFVPLTIGNCLKVLPSATFISILISYIAASN